VCKVRIRRYLSSAMAPQDASKGVFEIFTGKAGKTWFRLKAPNDEIILHSQGYKSMAGCKHGIQSVKNNCTDESRFDKLKSKAGKTYFNLVAKNKEIIGTSQMYKSPSGRNHGIKSVGRWAPDAEVVDLTAKKDEETVLKRPAAASDDGPAKKKVAVAAAPSDAKPLTLHISGPVTLTISGNVVEKSEEEEKEDDGDEEEEKEDDSDEEEQEDEEEADEAEEEDEEESSVAKKPAAMRVAMKAATRGHARKGVFEIFEGKGGKHYFRLRAANKEIILQSQGYASSSGAKAGVESVKKNAKASQFEIRKSKKGDPYFVLNAKGGTGSGKVIGMGETYQGGMGSCKHGIKSVIKNAKTAPVEIVDR